MLICATWGALSCFVFEFFFFFFTLGLFVTLQIIWLTHSPPAPQKFGRSTERTCSQVIAQYTCTFRDAHAHCSHQASHQWSLCYKAVSLMYLPPLSLPLPSSPYSFHVFSFHISGLHSVKKCWSILIKGTVQPSNTVWPFWVLIHI